MTKTSYKVYGNLGLDPNRVFRVLTILDTEAGSNFVRRAEFPARVEKYMKDGPLPDNCDDKSRPLPMLETVKLPRKFRNLSCSD